MDAVRALRERGIDRPEGLLEHAAPSVILATCRWWDGLTGVGTGLLVSRIRGGGVADEELADATERKLAGLRAGFEEYAERFPEGSVAEPHARMQQRRWPDDQACVGDLIVIEATYPSLSVCCDVCQTEAAYTVRALGALPSKSAAVRLAA